MSIAFLHNHSEYSTEGIASIKQLFQRAEAVGASGLALTDDSMGGVPSFLREASHHQDITTVVGLEIQVLSPGDDSTHQLILLCRNLAGYKSLVTISSHAETDGLRDGHPTVTEEFLFSHNEGLIAISGSMGKVAALLLTGRERDAFLTARRYQDIFRDDFYIGLPVPWDDSRSILDEDACKLDRLLFDVSAEAGIEALACPDVYYADLSDHWAQKVFSCIVKGTAIDDDSNPRYRMPMISEEDIRVAMGPFQSAVDNTNAILGKVDPFSIEIEDNIPEYPVPDGSSASEHFRRMALDGLSKRLNTEEVPAAYRDRLDEELRLFEDRKILDRILIVLDLTAELRRRGKDTCRLAGQAISSLACYAVGATDTDPVKYGLHFRWKHENANLSVILPATEIDTAYSILKDKYGREHVARESMYYSMGHGVALRNVLLAYGFSQDEAITAERMVPGHYRNGIPLLPFLQEEDLECLKSWYDNGSERQREAFLIADRLSGVTVGMATYSLGVLLSKMPVGQAIPVTMLGTSSELKSRYSRQATNFKGMDISLIMEDEDMIYRYSEALETDLGLSNGTVADMSVIDKAAIIALHRMRRDDRIHEFLARRSGMFTPSEGRLGMILEGTRGMLIFSDNIYDIAKAVGLSEHDSSRLTDYASKKRKDSLDSMHDAFCASATVNGFSVQETESLWKLVCNESYLTYPLGPAISLALRMETKTRANR